MKKFVFSLLTAILVVCNTHAQTSLVATLNHEGNITAYYGIDALSQAHSAAADGDVITLSSGTFNACDITKAVTIRGAGLEYSDGMEPSILQNNYKIAVAPNDNHALTMEGVFHNGTLSLNRADKALFFKCRFGTINTYGNGSSSYVTNVSFIHCKIATSFFLGYNDNVSFDNCFVRNPVKLNSTNYPSTNYHFNNCIVLYTGGNVYYHSTSSSIVSCPSNTGYSTFKNCVIYSSVTDAISNTFPNTNTLYHNVANVSCFANSLNSTNKVVSDFSSLFKTWTGSTYSDEEKFDLTDTAATTYLGDDGKQVGIYGGSLPYDPVPTHPQIVKCDVASKTTADGKLSVDIEVKGADY